MSCLATNSAPIFPWVVMGGYDGMYAFVVETNSNKKDSKPRIPSGLVDVITLQVL